MSWTVKFIPTILFLIEIERVSNDIVDVDEDQVEVRKYVDAIVDVLDGERHGGPQTRS